MIGNVLRTLHDSQTALLVRAAVRLEVLTCVDFPIHLCLDARSDVLADRLLTLGRRYVDDAVAGMRYTSVTGLRK